MATENEQFVEWFRLASPYIHVHRGRMFVVQIDDDVVSSDAFTHLVHDLALLASLGIKLVLVYGARHSIDARVHSGQRSSTFHRGRRLTDVETMVLVKEVSGKLLIDIQARLSMGLGNTPMSKAELHVATGNYISAKPIGIIDGIDYQFTGEIRRINTDMMLKHLSQNEIVLISPIGYSITGEAFNLAADELAAEIAVAMNADKLIYLVGKDVLSAVLADGTHANLTKAEVAEVLAELQAETDVSRTISMAIRACDAGIARTHILNQAEDGAILKELFSKDGSGVMVTAASYDQLHQATNADIAGIIDLITPLEQQGLLVQRSREKLELEIEKFTVLSRDGVIIACVALYPHESCAELACLAVDPAYQNGGRAEQLLTALETQARKLKVEQIFVLTTQAQHWFLERGFVETNIDDLPVAKQATYNYQRHSRVLSKNL